MKSNSEDHQLLVEQKQYEELPYNNLNRRPTSSVYFFPFIIAFLISICLNVLLSTTHFQIEKLTPIRDLRTPYARLSYDTPAIVERGGLWLDNDEAWESIQYYAGTIALDHERAASLGLPRAQNFPWDATKGIYFLNGHHGLHCLKRIRHTLVELRDGKPPTFPIEHSLHCLNALRQDILCHADDLPLYSSEEHPGNVGFGQHRICRSWEALERWSNENTACWRDINPGEDIDTLLRYRYCPPGTPYEEYIHAVFGDFDKGGNASATT